MAASIPLMTAKRLRGRRLSIAHNEYRRARGAALVAAALDASPEALRMASKCESVVSEIVDTEAAYVKDMRMVLSEFRDPLGRGSLVDVGLVAQVFLNLPVLVATNEEILRRMTSVSSARTPRALASAVLSMVPHLAHYAHYVEHHIQSLAALNEIKRAPRVAKFLAQRSGLLRGLDLSDFLVKPMQRLCKYPILFAELRKVIPDDSPDATLVESAARAMDEVVTQVNEKKRASESRFRINSIQESLGNALQLATPTRKLIAHAFAGARGLGPKPGKPSRVALFVFNDLVVVARPNKRLRKSATPSYTLRQATDLAVADLVLPLESQAELHVVPHDPGHGHGYALILDPPVFGSAVDAAYNSSSAFVSQEIDTAVDSVEALLAALEAVGVTAVLPTVAPDDDGPPLFPWPGGDSPDDDDDDDHNAAVGHSDSVPGGLLAVTRNDGDAGPAPDAWSDNPHGRGSGRTTPALSQHDGSVGDGSLMSLLGCGAERPDRSLVDTYLRRCLHLLDGSLVHSDVGYARIMDGLVATVEGGIGDPAASDDTLSPLRRRSVAMSADVRLRNANKTDAHNVSLWAQREPRGRPSAHEDTDDSADADADASAITDAEVVDRDADRDAADASYLDMYLAARAAERGEWSSDSELEEVGGSGVSPVVVAVDETTGEPVSELANATSMRVLVAGLARAPQDTVGQWVAGAVAGLRMLKHTDNGKGRLEWRMWRLDPERKRVLWGKGLAPSTWKQARIAQVVPFSVPPVFEAERVEARCRSLGVPARSWRTRSIGMRVQTATPLSTKYRPLHDMPHTLDDAEVVTAHHEDPEWTGARTVFVVASSDAEFTMWVHALEWVLLSSS